MIVTENAVDIKDLEQKIFGYCCAVGREMLGQALEGYDAELGARRDREKYRHKGKRKTVLKTVLGEVEYRRAVYETEDASGRAGYVYLLDEAMGISGGGKFSELLSQVIAQSCCENSYRGAAAAVSEMTGQALSHTAAWTVVQGLGERVDEMEQTATAQAQRGEGRGTLERKLLFEEQDGLWLKLQGASRKKHGPSHEMKLAIAYDGARQTGKKRYELTNKVSCANFESIGEFVKRKEGVIAQTYNTDEIQVRLLNGDGASWIRQSVTDETVHFQLDPYHRNKAIRMWVRHPKKQKTIMRLLYAKDIDGLLTYIEALSNSADDSEEGRAERENLLSLLAYFTNNKDGLIPCHRRGLDLPPPPEGRVYRRMGAMESNIFTILGNRMKGRRACWSIRGGNNLARLLCLKATKKLAGTLQSWTRLVLPEKYSEEVFFGHSSGKVAFSAGKGYNGFHSSSIPPQYHWMRDLFAIRPLSDL